LEHLEGTGRLWRVSEYAGASWSIWDGFGTIWEKMNFERFWRCME
jgi:hypothetical protein